MKSHTSNSLEQKNEEIPLDPAQFKSSWLDWGVGAFSIGENTGSIASFISSAIPFSPTNYLVGTTVSIICAFGTWYNVSEDLKEQTEREKEIYRSEMKVEKATEQTKLLLNETLQLRDSLHNNANAAASSFNTVEDKTPVTPKMQEDVVLPNVVSDVEQKKEEKNASELSNANATVLDNVAVKNKKPSLINTPKEKYLLSPIAKSPRGSITRVKTLKGNRAYEFENAKKMQQQQEAAKLVALARKMYSAKKPKKQSVILNKPTEHAVNGEVKIDLGLKTLVEPPLILQLTEANIAQESEKLDNLLESAKVLTAEKAPSNSVVKPDTVSTFTAVADSTIENSSAEPVESIPQVSWIKKYKPQLIETSMAFGKSMLKGAVFGNGVASFITDPYSADGYAIAAAIGITVGALGASAKYWTSNKTKVALNKLEKVNQKIDKLNSLGASIRNAYTSFYCFLKKPKAESESESQEENSTAEVAPVVETLKLKIPEESSSTIQILTQLPRQPVSNEPLVITVSPGHKTRKLPALNIPLNIPKNNKEVTPLTPRFKK